MMKIALLHPARKGEREIKELTFQDPKVRHFLALTGKDVTTVDADIALVAALTGEPEILIGEIDPEDWVKIREHLETVYKAFFGVKPAEKKKESDAREAREQEDPTKATEKN